MEKRYISAQQLLEDAFRLGMNIVESGFRPNWIIGVWRGGAPVGIAVQELLDFCDVDCNHIAIRTSLYTGIDKRAEEVRVHGIDFLVRSLDSEDSLLIIDDVFDSGRSMAAIIDELTRLCRKNLPHDIRIATAYYKPSKNRTQRIPDYFVHETEQWLVFPHELHGLRREEILEEKPGMETVAADLLALRGRVAGDRD